MSRNWEGGLHGKIIAHWGLGKGHEPKSGASKVDLEGTSVAKVKALQKLERKARSGAVRLAAELPLTGRVRFTLYGYFCPGRKAGPENTGFLFN